MLVAGTEGCVKCQSWRCPGCFVEKHFCVEDFGVFLLSRVNTSGQPPRTASLPTSPPKERPGPSTVTNAHGVVPDGLEDPESPASTTTDSDTSYSEIMSSAASPTASENMDMATPITATSSPGSQASEEEEIGRNLIGELLARSLPPLENSLQANQILDALFSRYHQWRQAPAGQARRQHGNRREAARRAGNTNQNSTANLSSSSGQRGEADDDSEEEPVPETEGDLPRRRSVQVLFACPYWKRDCQVWRDCFGYRLTGVKYVKDHLKRVHAKICYCDRCGVEFDNKGRLQTHRRSPLPCMPREFSNWWLSETQKAILSKRPNPKQSPEAQWYAVWDVIFPSHPKPDSPYIDQEISEDLSSFLEFARVQGPDIVRDMGADISPGIFHAQLLQMSIRRIYSQWASERGQAPMPPRADEQVEHGSAMAATEPLSLGNEPVLDDASTNLYAESQTLQNLDSQFGDLTEEDLAYFD